MYPGFPVGLGGSGGRGVAVTPVDDDVWTACSYSNTVVRFNNSGVFRKSIPVGAHPTGVARDANGKVWVTNYNGDSVMRIDPDGGGDGLGQVDLVVSLGSGAGPYNYSDMTGAIAVGLTSQQGSWTVVYDGLLDDLDWGTIAWTSDEPVGTEVKVEARAANARAGLAGVAFRPVGNGISFHGQGVRGRYIEMRTTLSRGPGITDTPVLYDLTVSAPVAVPLQITPGFDPNVVVLSKPYTIYAAIMGSDDVSVAQILPASVRFGRTGTEAAPVRAGRVIDLNGDGRLDILYGFKTAACGFMLGDTQGVIRAVAGGGVVVEGRDAVMVMP